MDLYGHMKTIFGALLDSYFHQKMVFQEDTKQIQQRETETGNSRLSLHFT